MKTHDALGRRDRYKRIPSLTEADSPLVPNQGDIAMIEAIHHHGPLSSIYLPEFRKPHGVSRQVAVRRLNFLFNETRAVDGGAYLSRPLHQTRTEYAHSKHLVYDLTPASEKLLKRLGKWSASAPSSRNPWTHAFMVSSITASIDLACRRAGLSFIPGHELLDRAETTLRQTVGFKWKGRELTVDLTPDALFAIDYGGKYRVFMVEADRGTEPILTSTASRKSIYRNLLQYRAFVGEGVYQKAYKLQARAVVLNVFPSQTRMESVLKMVEEESRANSYMLFQTVDDFGIVFRPPQIFHHLFLRPWKRAGRDPFYINLP